MPELRAYRAGESLEDYCRACKTDRAHTVIAADSGGRPLRVVCGFCRSEHHYRGGGRISTGDAPTASSMAGPRRDVRAAGSSPPGVPTASAPGDPFPFVSDRERTAPPMRSSPDNPVDLEMLLRRVIREETGLSAVTPADKWRGGTLVLKPGTAGLQEKSWPIETFFHKIVMLRNRLRTLEQQLNASDVPDEAKVKMQTYITGCYGSLTSFNVLFADEDDQFKGSGGD
jgi:hypothetical protein